MPIERKLAAIMFTDIVGYTALSAKDSTKSSELLKTQRELLKPIVEKHGGSWMKEMGDGLLLTFDSATSAVECSIAIQKSTKEIDGLNLRIGIHEGEVIKQDGDVLGDDVNVAARIEPFSAEGGVAISQKVQQAISSNKEFETKFIGTPKLKGVSQKVEVYCITSHALPETDISKVSAKLEQESKLPKFALFGGLSILVAALFFVFSSEDEEKVPSIAIIPLENKGESKDEFYSYSISSDLISDVSGAGDIRVASLKDIEKLDYKSLTNSEIAKKLYVRYISQGTLWKVDSIFQLSMELFDTKKNRIKWSNNWQHNWSELPSIKGGLSENILNNLLVTTKQDITKAESENAEAYELYLKAKNIYDKRENTDDIEAAQGLLKKVIELDENLIAAKLIFGDSYLETGISYLETGDIDEAIEIYNSALTKAEELGDKVWIGRSTRKVGNTFYYKNEYDIAVDNWNKAFEIAEQIGDKLGIGRSLINIGNIHSNKGEYDKALENFERSLTIAEELGDKRGIGVSLNSIGVVHRNKGDYDKALEYYKSSLAIAEEIGYKRGMGNTLFTIGTVHINKGEYDTALEYYGRSLAIKEKLGDKPGMLASFNNMGNMHFNKGDYDKALEYYKSSLAIAEEIGHKHNMVLNVNNIGMTHFRKCDYKKAAEHLEKSLNIKKELGWKELETTTYLYLSYRHLSRDYDEKHLHSLIKDAENIEFDLNFGLYQLLEDISYLETAYNQVQEKASAMEKELAEKFLSNPIPKTIVEERENLNK